MTATKVTTIHILQLEREYIVKRLSNCEISVILSDLDPVKNHPSALNRLLRIPSLLRPDFVRNTCWLELKPTKKNFRGPGDPGGPLERCGLTTGRVKSRSRQIEKQVAFLSSHSILLLLGMIGLQSWCLLCGTRQLWTVNRTKTTFNDIEWSKASKRASQKTPVPVPVPNTKTIRNLSSFLT
jgi:hypothetical protein